MKKNFFKFFLLSIFALPLAGIIFIGKAEAVPGFARMMNLPCSGCHTIWPQLNEFGRSFKAGGFDMGEVQKINDDLSLPRSFPISARLNLRLVDKQTTGDAQLKIRAFHEGELFIAGKATDKLSYFLELESEDEWGLAGAPSFQVQTPEGVVEYTGAPGFQVQIPEGVAEYSLHKYAAVALGYGSPFYQDGYNTLHHHKTTRRLWQASSYLPSASQFVSLGGKVNRLGYILAFHGLDARLEGDDANDVSLRLVSDLPFNLSLGAYYNQGKNYNSTLNKSQNTHRRYGVDLQYDREYQGNIINLNLVYALREGDQATATAINDPSVVDDALSLELQYIIRKGKTPWIAPLLMVDAYHENDRADYFTDVGFFLTHFIKENLRCQLGWEENGLASRFSVAFDVGF